MRWVYLILLLVIVVIVVVFVAQNREDQTVAFFQPKDHRTPVDLFRRDVLPGHVERRDRRRLFKRAYQHATEHEEQKRAS